MKTFSPTPKDIDRQWFVVDAQDQVLGRLASRLPIACAASTSLSSPRIWITGISSWWSTVKRSR